MVSDKTHQIFRKLKNQTWCNVNDDKSTWSVLNFTFELSVKKGLAEQISIIVTTW